MNTYSFGPLTAEVESLGKATPWPGKERFSYHVLVRDKHGNSFEAGWYLDQDNPELVAQRIVSLLWYAAYDREFDFYGGYQGEERTWRAREARRLKEAGKKFDEMELTKAAAKAGRKMAYESERGPRDWSPIEEIPYD